MQPVRQKCSECGLRVAHTQGMCRPCYRDAFSQDMAADDARAEELNIDLPLLLATDIDKIAAEASTLTQATYDLGTPEENESPGVTRLRNYLASSGAYFRRQVIRKLMMVGLSQKEIFVEFLRTPALRKRWIDPIGDPRRIFFKDFNAIANEKRAAKTSRARREQRIDRLELQYREMMSLANSKDIKPDIRFKALEAAAKWEREIAVMEKTISPTRGLGDMPVLTNEDDEDRPAPDATDEDEEDDADEEWGGYRLTPVD